MSLLNVETDRPSVANGGRWATVQPLDDCRAMLHKTPFRLTHALSTDPLFQLDTLLGAVKEAARRGKGDLYFDAGNVTLSDKWGDIPVPDMSILEIMRRIETANAWVILKHVEANPKYRAVLEDFTYSLDGLIGPENARLLKNPEMLVIISSPGRVTPFHIDGVANFFVQVHGSKDLWVCNPYDRTVVTEDEIERFYMGELTAAAYKPHAEEVASHFVMEPDQAIHIPSHGAHWVKNRDNVSVSLSLNYNLPSWLKSDVYQANHLLRRLGMSPRPPGHSVWLDRSKSVLMKARRLLGVSPKEVVLR